MKKTNSPMPILIIQTAFIGDTILASSFAQRVHQSFPESEIHFLLRHGNQSVIEGLPFVHKVWIWNKKQGKLLSLIKLILQLRKMRFSFVFNIHRHFNSGLITYFMKARMKVGFKQNPLSFFYDKKINHRIPHTVSGESWHEVQRNLQLLIKVTFLGMTFDPKELRPTLPVTESHEKKVLEYKTKDFVVVAPASVWFTKQWEEESYQRLVERLSEKFQVLLIGGPDDRELCERVKGQTEAINLCGKLNLLESAALMKGARRVFVNDSGPLHLASCMNAPTTAFFCATITEFGYGPLADDCVVLESPEKLDCRPCGLHGHKTCPEAHFKCAKNITVEMALNSIAY
jgi:lipopolysaccharide heptosyltransferase II